MHDAARALTAVGLAVVLAGCVVIPDAQRTVVLRDDGGVGVDSPRCGTITPAGIADGASAAALDPAALRIASWNLHKGEDPGWEGDLARIAATHDVVLLQEVLLTERLRVVLETAGLRWQLASSFTLNGRDAGVLTAARATPLSACSQSVQEPLIALPKSALVVRFRLAGHQATLAVANMHAINFTLATTGAYQEQLDAVGAELAIHEGPIVFAGDFNTWNETRLAAVKAMARRLGLLAVVFRPDGRQQFAGHEVDHIYVRGLDVVAAAAVGVTSSDHNPVFAILRLSEGAH
jgi:endonuclease/exonuclease/phosphatase (EEP) superfamily protein YafD